MFHITVFYTHIQIYFSAINLLKLLFKSSLRFKLIIEFEVHLHISNRLVCSQKEFQGIIYLAEMPLCQNDETVLLAGSLTGSQTLHLLRCAVTVSSVETRNIEVGKELLFLLHFFLALFKVILLETVLLSDDQNDTAAAHTDENTEIKMTKPMHNGEVKKRGQK